MPVSGTWYNELGSQMQIQTSGSSVWGWYYTAVGHAYGTYPMAGQINTKPYPFSQGLGWAVAWNNAYLTSHSVTAWSGQYQTIDGDEEIIAFWLLTSEVAPPDDWEATKVGQDVFRRTSPSEEEIERNRKKISAAHPLGKGK